jgi:Fic family protein
MAYHVVREIKDGKYHYLVKSIRIDGGWKKFSVYLGKGELSEEEVEALMGEKAPELEEKVDAYLRRTDPLYALISRGDAERLEEIRKKAEGSLKDMPEEARQKYYEWFVTSFTYNSNAIEGSTVALDETGMILFDQVVPRGKTLREIREVENHRRAFDFAVEYERDISMRFILKIHALLTEGILEEGSGELRRVQVYIRGADIIPPPAEEVEGELKGLLRWYRRARRRYHPVVVASYFHTAFEGIHPFVDFNGRTGRILLNFILKKAGYPMVDIKNEDKLDYYGALAAGQQGDLKPFVDLIQGYLFETRV